MQGRILSKVVESSWSVQAFCHDGTCRSSFVWPLLHPYCIHGSCLSPKAFIAYASPMLDTWVVAQTLLHLGLILVASWLIPHPCCMPHSVLSCGFTFSLSMFVPRTHIYWVQPIHTPIGCNLTIAPFSASLPTAAPPPPPCTDASNL